MSFASGSSREMARKAVGAVRMVETLYFSMTTLCEELWSNQSQCELQLKRRTKGKTQLTLPEGARVGKNWLSLKNNRSASQKERSVDAVTMSDNPSLK